MAILIFCIFNGRLMWNLRFSHIFSIIRKRISPPTNRSVSNTQSRPRKILKLHQNQSPRSSCEERFYFLPRCLKLRIIVMFQLPRIHTLKQLVPLETLLLTFPPIAGSRRPEIRFPNITSKFGLAILNVRMPFVNLPCHGGGRFL